MAIQMSIIKIPGAVKGAAPDGPRRLSPVVLPWPPVRSIVRACVLPDESALPANRTCRVLSPPRTVRAACRPWFCPGRPCGAWRAPWRLYPPERKRRSGQPSPAAFCPSTAASRSRRGGPVSRAAPSRRDRRAPVVDVRLLPRSFATYAPVKAGIETSMGRTADVRGRRSGRARRCPAFRSPFSQYNRCDLDPSRRCPAFRSPFSQYNRCDLDPSRRSPLSGRRFSSTIVATSILRAAAPLSGRRFSSTIVATSILRAAARFPVAVFPAFRPSFRRIVNHIIVFG